MSGLKELMNGKYFIYQISDGGCGLVKANNKNEAKLYTAFLYHKHGQPEIKTCDIEVFDISRGGYFEDCPYVIELGWSIEVV